MSNQQTASNNQSQGGTNQQQQQQQGTQQMFTIPTGNGGTIQIPANAFSGGKFSLSFFSLFGAWLTHIVNYLNKIISL